MATHKTLRKTATKDSKDELARLRMFFDGVADATVNHSTRGGYAVVYPSVLSRLLEKVDPKWWERKP